jgi:hypothetical protein
VATLARDAGLDYLGNLRSELNDLYLDKQMAFDNKEEKYRDLRFVKLEIIRLNHERTVVVGKGPGYKALLRALDEERWCLVIKRASIEVAFGLAEEEYLSIKSQYDLVKKDYDSKSGIVKVGDRDQRKALAIRAKVPKEYLGDDCEVCVALLYDRSVRVRYGGLGKPDGPGYGQHIVQPDGKVVCKRAPCDPSRDERFSQSLGVNRFAWA